MTVADLEGESKRFTFLVLAESYMLIELFQRHTDDVMIAHYSTKYILYMGFLLASHAGGRLFVDICDVDVNVRCHGNDISTDVFPVFTV